MSALVRTGDRMANDHATAHVIDDNVSPSEALNLLFPSVGLNVRTYLSVREFLGGGDHDDTG